MVQRDDTSSADRRSGFDSRWVPFRKVAGYGWPGRSAKADFPTEMRVRLPCLPLAPMVKRTSSHGSNLGFRVQILVGVLDSPVVQRQDIPVTWGRSLVRIQPGLLIDGVCSVAGW